MVKPVFRRKSIGTKVSEEGYAKLVQAPVDITASAFGAITCAASE